MTTMILNTLTKNNIKKNFLKGRINVLFFDSFNDVKDYLLTTIPTTASIGIGHSQTLQNMSITSTFKGRGNIVYDKELGKTKDEVVKLKKQSLLADYYISSANAVSIDGCFVNIDHSGNRVAAIAYGPDKVFIVVGINKLVEKKEEAIARAKNTAAPKNAKRAGFTPPCVEIGKCIDCNSSERVCHYLSITTGQSIKNRLELIIVNQEAGF